MGSKNDTIISGVENLPQEELVEQYEKLADSYRKLKQENDESRQQLHLQTKQTKVLINSQNDLQNDLQCIHSVHKQELHELTRKNSATVENLKEKNKELLIEKIHLETRNDDLSRQLVESQKTCEELKTKSINQRQPTRFSDSFSKNLELENEKLQIDLNEIEAKLRELTELSLEKESKIEELKEERLCLEDNLESKKSEIEEKNDAIESLQEQVQELTMELAMTKTSSVDADRKGNSLFAEVDDQRQKMKTILQGERNHYLEMKKTCNGKEMEIRRLKRENMNIKKEIQACSSLLMRGEQISLQALTSQVALLQNDNRNLEQLLASTEKKLIDLAKDQNFGWMESLLSTSNNDTRCFKEKLFTTTSEKTLLADILSKNQRELAKARLDCIKYKILLDRIVVSNNINLVDEDFIDIGLDEEVLEKLKIERFETVDETFEESSISQPEGLSESTINLIGGRERLGHFVPAPTVNSKFDENSVADKENVKLIKEEKISPTSEKCFGNPKSPAKPLKPSRTSGSSPKTEKEKNLNFSSNVETKGMDGNQEQIVQSQQARKRLPVIVRRIVIPSKASVKKLE